MHIGQAAKFLSEELSIKHAAVEAVAQRLRDAGRIRSGARGRHAPHISDLEMARLLIALMSSESPAGAVQRYEFFAKLDMDSSASRVPAIWLESPAVTSFEEHFALLLGLLRLEPEQAENVRVTMHIYLGSAEILFGNENWLAEDHFNTKYEAPLELEFEERHPYWSGINRISEILGPTLARIAAHTSQVEGE